MLDKTEKFLPPDICSEIGQYFPNSTLLNFALVSKGHLKAFKFLLNIRKCLEHVVCGKHNLVSKMLEENINLIYQKGYVIDRSGRIFNNISPFEYSLWALDTHMWTLMLDCVSQSGKSHEVLPILSKQYENLSNQGITYTLNEKRITQTHFDFNNIFAKLAKIANCIERTENVEKIDLYWTKIVGIEQLELPIHAVFEYCSEEPFSNKKEFTTRPKKESTKFQFGKGEYKNWFAADSMLGSGLAIYKGPNPFAVGSSYPLSSKICYQDLSALQKLCMIRTKDFEKLKSQLEERMTWDNHRQSFQI